MSATATVKHLDPTQVELEIEIPQTDLEAAREKAFRQLVRNVRIPGFRPGKAPRRIFEAQYGTHAIEERAMDEVVPEAYSKALQENDLEPIERPQMELLPQEDEAGPLRLRATVAIRPAIEVKDYKGVALEAPAINVTDEDVEAAVTQLRKDAGQLLPVDRPVELGDTPTIDYLGSIDGVPFEGGAAQNQPTEILEERFIPGFASGIVGMKAGESKDVEAEFPADYSNTDLAGKKAVFAITVHDNKVSEPAPLDDALAKRFLGDEASLDTLRDDIRNRIEANQRQQRNGVLSGVLLKRIGEANEVPLPEPMVERETEALETEAKGYIERAGLTWDAYLEGQGKTPEDVRAEYRKQASDRVKTTLLLEAIAKAESIRATPEDVENEVAQLAGRYGQTREAVRKMLAQNYGALVDGIVRTKTMEWLIENATITDLAPGAAFATE